MSDILKEYTNIGMLIWTFIEDKFMAMIIGGMFAWGYANVDMLIGMSK